LKEDIADPVSALLSLRFWLVGRI